MFVQDGTILVWKQHPESKIPEPAAMVREHKGAVCSLVIGANNRLYSGSEDCTIKVFVARSDIPPKRYMLHSVYMRLVLLFLMMNLKSLFLSPGMGPSKYAVCANSNWTHKRSEVCTLLGQIFAIRFTGQYIKGLDVHLYNVGL